LTNRPDSAVESSFAADTASLMATATGTPDRSSWQATRRIVRSTTAILATVHSSEYLDSRASMSGRWRSTPSTSSAA
jgi:hypothetical protein